MPAGRGPDLEARPARVLEQLRAAGERFRALAGSDTGSPVRSAARASRDQPAPAPGEDPWS